MPARKITVDVELCDPDTGEMQITVEDPGNPVDEWTYQDMVLHPATCSLLKDLLNAHAADGGSYHQTISLNAP